MAHKKAPLTKVEPDEVPMGRYGSNRGHHIPAKDTVAGSTNASTLQLDAPSIPLSNLETSKQSGVELHRDITKFQRAEYKKLYQELGGSADDMTWDQVRIAEVDAHISAGYSQQQAEAMVDHGIKHYTDAGITKPSKIPWSSTFSKMKDLLGAKA